MAELKGNKKKRLTINLSFFTPNEENPNNNDMINSGTTTNKSKSSKNFEGPYGVVGLGIVAAMNEELDQGQAQDPLFSAKSAILAVFPRSNPIPIFSRSISTSVSGKSGGGGKVVGPDLEGEREEEIMELSEEYTCVISHIGNNLIKKREYFDGNFGGGGRGSMSESGGGDGGSTTSYWLSSGVVFSASSPVVTATVFGTGEDFLSSCYICEKKLQGLDIFMYRGEKAFCSAECRCKQISIDEHKEKCGTGVVKPIEYSVSPCSCPTQFYAGVAAA